MTKDTIKHIAADSVIKQLDSLKSGQQLSNMYFGHKITNIIYHFNNAQYHVIFAFV